MGKYNKIEIDQELYDYLVKNMVEFGETPNSVLRRLLFENPTAKNRNQASRFKNKKIIFYQHPSYIPTALTQILDLVYLMDKFGISRNEATNLIARERNIYPQTVMDKYCRQLNLKANQIDQILAKNDLTFYKILRTKFFSSEPYITQFFKQNMIQAKSLGIDSFSPFFSDFKTFEQLIMSSVQELVNVKPHILIIGGQKFLPNNWSDVDEIIVKELFKLGFLTVSKLPIKSSDRKYFVNIKPKHEDIYADGDWKQILPGVYLDRKYNVLRHCKNIFYLVKKLKLDKTLQLAISLKINT